MVPDESLPKITVVTPSFNQGMYLEECIKSVVNQNYPNLEYIVIDGGSSDDSVSIINKYSDRLYYWHSRPDGGQSDAIKQGLDKGSGEIYAWLNSDDIMCKNALFKVSKAFQRDKTLGLIYGDAFLIDQNTELKRTLIPGGGSFKQFIYGGSSIFQGSVFFSSKAYEKVGGINTELTFSMEYELFFKIAQLFKIQYVPEFLACFRQQPLSKSSTIRDVGREESKKILKQACQLDRESFKYKSMKFLLSNKRRIKNLAFGKIWHLRKSYYKKVFREKLNHIC